LDIQPNIMPSLWMQTSKRSLTVIKYILPASDSTSCFSTPKGAYVCLIKSQRSLFSTQPVALTGDSFFLKILVWLVRALHTKFHVKKYAPQHRSQLFHCSEWPQDSDSLYGHLLTRAWTCRIRSPISLCAPRWNTPDACRQQLVNLLQNEIWDTNNFASSHFLLAEETS
jgi:hypothetical protein